jgi:hypothetical protein
MNWLFTKQAPITIIGVLVLGILGSTLYDLLVKPGLSTFGRIGLDFITLGSETVKNYAYASAALDPTPVTSLYLLQIVLIIACFPAARMIGRIISKNKNKKVDETSDEQQLTLLRQESGRLKAKLRVLEWFFWITFLPWLFLTFVAFSVHNQSILIWRVFNANITIVAPVTSDADIKQLKASYCAMKSRNDYLAIKSKIKSIASKNNIEITQIDTW